MLTTLSNLTKTSRSATIRYEDGTTSRARLVRIPTERPGIHLTNELLSKDAILISPTLSECRLVRGCLIFGEGPNPALPTEISYRSWARLGARVRLTVEESTVHRFEVQDSKELFREDRSVAERIEHAIVSFLPLEGSELPNGEHRSILADFALAGAAICLVSAALLATPLGVGGGLALAGAALGLVGLSRWLAYELPVQHAQPTCINSYRLSIEPAISNGPLSILRRLTIGLPEVALVRLGSYTEV